VDFSSTTPYLFMTGAQLSKRTTFKFKRGSFEIKTLALDKHV